jgi:hypothetical protein
MDPPARLEPQHQHAPVPPHPAVPPRPPAPPQVAPAAWAAQPPAPEPWTPAPARPADGGSKTRLLIWLVLAAIVLAALVTGGILLLNHTIASGAGAASSGEEAAGANAEAADPVRTVEEYLEKLAEGDAGGARDLASTGEADSSWVPRGATLLDGALAGADEWIRVLAVEEISASGDSASVRATLQLDGAQFEHVFTLSPDAASGWRIDQPLVALVEIGGTGIGRATVGGVPVDLSTAGAVVALSPGVYEIAGEASGVFDAQPQRVVVTVPRGTPQAVTLAATPNEEFRKSVLTQVQARIEQCTHVPGNMDPECPSITRDTKLIELSVSSLPSDFESFSETGFVSQTAVITVRSVPTSGDPDPAPRRSEFQLAGGIRIVDGAPQIVDVSAH